MIFYTYWSHGNKHSKELLVFPTSCELWPEFYCATLADLEKDIFHLIQISERYDIAFDFGPPQEVVTITKTEQSKAPYNLKVSWTLQNDLILEWKHPNETNGNIQYFDIIISNSTQPNLLRNKLNITSDMYNLTYFYQINAREFVPTSSYNVSVFAFNNQRGFGVSESTASPPEILTLTSDRRFNISKHSIEMTIFLKNPQGKTDNYRMIILRSDRNTNVNSFHELQNFDLSNLKVVIDCNLTGIQHTFILILGRSQLSTFSTFCKDIDNSLLEAATSYNVTIILINMYNNQTRNTVYTMTFKTTSKSNSWLFALLLLLLIIPAVAYCYIKRKKRPTKMHLKASQPEIELNNIERTNQLPLQLLPNTQQNIVNINKVDIDENPTSHSKLVSVDKFNDYFKMALENQELQKQHERILEIILTYEPVLVDSLRSDFIDLHFNSGLQIKNAYIITKFPTTVELDDFWKVVVDENVKHIVLFAHLHPNQKESTNYWPDVGKSLHCGNIIIECNMSQKYTFHTYRKFSLKCRNKVRKIDQLHLSLPTNENRYLSSLNYVQFFKKMSKIPHNTRSPILVHSSADMRGISFALLCDMSLRSIRIDGAIDVMANYKKLIQTTTEMKIEFDHYVAAHAIIADTLVHMDTSVTFNSFDCSQPELFTEEEIQKHLQYLKDTLWLDEIVIEEGKYLYMNCPTILQKNKQRHVEPSMCSIDRSQLEELDFLKVGGFKAPGKFRVTKSTPLSDFLVKVQKRKISVIVTLNNNIFTWPSEDHPEIVVNNDITLKYKVIKKLRFFDWITLDLTTNNTTQTVDVVTFKQWSASLPKVSEFVNFVIDSNEIFHNTEPVLVTCHDGTTYCGLYLAMSYITQQIKTESICDVCTCIRTLRRHHQNFVKDDKQYNFLLEAAHNYMKEFSLYEVR